jgi:hypothetical protein
MYLVMPMLPDRYVAKQISKIAKTDKRVSVVGRVEDVDEGGQSFSLSDDSGKVEVFFGNADTKQKSRAEIGRIVRAFLQQDEERLRLDALQDLSGLDLNLAKTVDELYRKAGF